MNIGIVIYNLSVRGGEQRQALKLAIELQKMGNVVAVFAGKFDIHSSYKRLIEELNVIPANRKEFVSRKGIFEFVKKLLMIDSETLYYLNEIKKNLIEYSLSDGLDIINYHDFFSYRISRHFNIPQVWMLNDLPHIIDSKFRRAHPFPKNIFVNILATLASLNERRFLKNINVISVLDKRNYCNVKKTFGNAVNVEVVRSGVAQVSTNDKKNWKRKSLNLLTTNIFFPHRRYEDVLLALKMLNANGFINWKYTIIGDTSMDPSYSSLILQMIKTLGLGDQINLLGKVSEKRLIEEYHKSHIFLFPNHNQTWGLSVFEAMSYGCVPIVSKSSGASEVLTHKFNSLLVRPLDPSQIYLSLRLLFQRRELGLLMSKNATSLPRELSWGNYSLSMIKIFNQVIDKSYSFGLKPHR